MNGKYIRGFGVPKYDKEASVKPATPAAPSAPATKKNYVLKNGSAKVGYATSRNNSLAGTYVTTSDLNMRTGAGTGNTVILTLLEGAEVKCYGYYSTKDGVNGIWSPLINTQDLSIVSGSRKNSMKWL